MHIAAVEQLNHEMIPALEAPAQACRKKTAEFKSIIKIGPTHLQDARRDWVKNFRGTQRKVKYGIERVKACLLASRSWRRVYGGWQLA